MSPVAAAKTNEIGDELWKIFHEDMRLGDVDRFRFAKEIEALKRADPDAAAPLEAMLAAICNDDSKALQFAATAKNRGFPPESYCNLTSILSHLGKMEEAYTLIREAWERHPGNVTIIEMVIDLADAFEDAPVLEAALTAWQNLRPGQTHPLVALHTLESGLVGVDMDALEDRMADFLNATPSQELRLSPRDRRRTREILGKASVE